MHLLEMEGAKMLYDTPYSLSRAMDVLRFEPSVRLSGGP
jgi:hypothetical protein